MLKKVFLFIILGTTGVFYAQNNINNPYSLYGLGAENVVATGSLSGLGNTGIARNNNIEINLFNPASLGNIKRQSFLQDLGGTYTYSTVSNANSSQNYANVNVSHISFAFPIKKGWGIGLGLLPYTQTGYEINTENNIEGSTDVFITNVLGYGGINKFYLSNGIKLWDSLSLGLDFGVLFGTITEETTFVVANLANFEDENYYSGFRFKTGFQYEIPKLEKVKVSIGGTVELPSVLKGEQTREAFKISPSGEVVTLEDGEVSDLEDLELPLSLGLGTTVAYDKITANFDFQRTFWSNTNQDSDAGEYVDQTKLGLGVEYKEIKPSLNYFKNVSYRAGLNYNSGFLQISDQKINDYFASVGLGLPIGRKNYLNLSYSYGVQGVVSNKLIQEKYHKISLSLALKGNWFKKRKIY